MAQAEATPGCRLEDDGEGSYRLVGDLGFDAAAGLLERGSRAFQGGGRVRIDLSGVTDADSAGLAVLLEWVRLVRAAGGEIGFARLPGRLGDLARIGGVAGFLPSAD